MVPPQSISRARRRLPIVWLSLATILTSATQLRSTSILLGPGEILLASWLGWRLLTLLARGSGSLSHLMVEIFFFWLAAFLLLSLGWLQAVRIGVWDTAAYHDLVAYLFVFCVAWFAAEWLEPDSALRVAHSMTLMSGGILLCLLLVGSFFPVVGPLKIWYEGDVLRFTAWAENPNQTALLACPLPFLALHLLKVCQTAAKKWAYSLLSLSLLFVGVMTGSDALTAAWSLSFSVLAWVWWVRCVRSRRAGYWRPVLTKLLLPVGVLTLIAIISVLMGEQLVEKLSSELNSGNQAVVRFTLWRHGIEAMLASPIFGLGPGSYSGLGAPFQHTEAHNTLIDWGMSSGIVGVLLLLSAYAVVLWRMRTKSLFLFGAALSLLAFSFFHYVLRQPLFWLYLILCLRISSLPERSRGQATTRAFRGQNA